MIDLNLLDRVVQKVESTPAGTFLRAYDGATVLNEVALSSSKVPGEINDLMLLQRTAIAYGVDSFIGSKVNPVTGKNIFSDKNMNDALGLHYGKYGNIQNFLPLDPVAAWDERAGVGMTVELDPTVLFDGKPTIKVTLPAGLTTGRIGTTLATGVLPYGWDRSGAVLAVRCSKISANGAFGVFLGSAAGFATNTLQWGQAPASYAQSTRDNEWLVYHMDSTANGGLGWAETGTYAAASTAKLRISFNLTAAQTEPVVFWVGAFGVKQKRPKSTLVPTYDDCLASTYTHVYPLFKANRIPCSFAVISSAIGTAGYMTAAQILEMANDPSGLFEFLPHSSTHIDAVTRGDAQYVADVVAARDFLKGIGITTDSINHHAYVQSIWTNGVIDGLIANGFKSARAAGQASPHRVFSDACYRAGDKAKWLLNCLTTLGNTKDGAAMIAEVDAFKARGGGYAMLNGHAFAATSSDAYTMSITEHTQLITYIAQQRDAGNLELMRWSEWFDTYCS